MKLQAAKQLATAGLAVKRPAMVGPAAKRLAATAAELPPKGPAMVGLAAKRRAMAGLAAAPGQIRLVPTSRCLHFRNAPQSSAERRATQKV